MLLAAGSEAYATATRPHNSSSVQRPGRVEAIAQPSDLSAALDAVGDLAQSTGRTLIVLP